MRVLRILLAWGALTAAISAQSTTSATYTTDLNGRRVADGLFRSETSGAVTTTSELTRSINGRLVPLEQMEERLVREDSEGRVVERLIRKFNADGSPGQPERQRIEERKNADGSVSTVTSIYRADLNGSFQLAERVRSESSKSGGATQANVTVERPTVNGALEVVEKRTVTAEESGSGTAVTLRRNVSGQFYEAVRVVTDAQEQNGVRILNQATYEAGGSGRLELHTQTVSRIRQHPDGTVSREVDLFRRVPGRAETAGPKLEERQIVEQRKSGDQVVEITAVQRPSINDPGRLGPPVKISERVCSGANCK